MASGIRNWRGEIVERAAPSGGEAIDADAGANLSSVPAEPQPRAGSADGIAGPDTKRKHREKKKKARKKDARDGPVFVKDEFGRDVEVTSESDKKKRKRRDKRSRTASRSPARARNGTPPPADLFRPQLDENRYGSRRRPERNARESRSRSRSRDRRAERNYRRSRSRSESRRCQPPSRRNRSRSRDRSRSRSRGRSRSQSRSRNFNQESRRRSSASTERKWTHDAFDDRSPSPPRQTDPFYKPEPEGWVSRAGGVYIPRK